MIELCAHEISVLVHVSAVVAYSQCTTPAVTMCGLPLLLYLFLSLCLPL